MCMYVGWVCIHTWTLRCYYCCLYVWWDLAGRPSDDKVRDRRCCRCSEDPTSVHMYVCIYIREYGFYFFIHTYINRYIHQHMIGTDLIDSDKLVGSKPAVIEHRYLYMCLKKYRSGYFKMLHIHTYIHTYIHACIHSYMTIHTWASCSFFRSLKLK